MDKEKIIFNIPFQSIRLETDMSILCAKKYRLEHFHNEAEIVLVIEGEIALIADGKRNNIKSGESAVICGGVIHRLFGVADKSECVMLQFNFNDEKENESIKPFLAMIAAFNTDPYIILGADSEISEIMRELRNEVIRKEKGYEMFVRADILRITAILFRYGIIPDYTQLKSNSNIKRLYPVIEYINNHYEEQIGLQDMADMIGVDKFYFCKLFKVITKMSFIEYLTHIRLSAAEKLLCSGNNITETAENTGFASLQYFDRCFRHFFGCSPSEYKKNRETGN